MAKGSETYGDSRAARLGHALGRRLPLVLGGDRGGDPRRGVARPRGQPEVHSLLLGAPHDPEPLARAGPGLPPEDLPGSCRGSALVYVGRQETIVHSGKDAARVTPFGI